MKLPNGMNMKEFCHVASGNRSISRDNCTEEALEKARLPGLPRATCPSMLDLGCFAIHSFGELTLVNYLEKAKQLLPDVHNAFVMTDDGPWLEDQIAALPKDGTDSGVSHYKVGRLAAEKEARNERRSDGRKANGTRYSVDFWTSVTVARHCQGFVGHFGSGVSAFVYTAMCFNHAGLTGECPVGADIGGRS